MNLTSPVAQSLPRLLVLEDDDDDYWVYAQTLARRFHLRRFQTANELIEFLGQALEADYDLLLLDLLLPDGYSIVRLSGFLKERAGHVPFVLISGRDDESFQRTTYDLGGLDYIVKPFSTNELMIRLENALVRGRVRAAERIFEFILPPIQLRILKAVLGAPDQRVPKIDLAKRLWRAPLSSSTSCLKTHLTSLKKALPEHGFILETRSGDVAIKRVGRPGAFRENEKTPAEAWQGVPLQPEKETDRLRSPP